MSPPGAEGSFSLSGLPAEIITMMQELAEERDCTLKALYTKAASDLLSAVKNGERIDYISTLGGSSRKTVWIDPDVAADLDALRKSVRRSRSSVMLTAIKRLLVTNGRTVEF